MALDPRPLETPSLLIRRFTAQDAATMLVLSQEEPSRTWLPSQVYRDDAHARSAIEYLIEQSSAPANPRHGPYVLAIEHRSDGVLIGHVGFSPLDDEVEIGFAIAQAYQGKGLATEALVTASRWALEAFELERILGITATANLGSKAVLVRAGFAHQRDEMMNFQGTEQRVSVYALCRDGTREGRAE